MIDDREEVIVGRNFIERRVFVSPTPRMVAAENIVRRAADNRLWVSGFKAGFVGAIMFALFVGALVELFR